MDKQTHEYICAFWNDPDNRGSRGSLEFLLNYWGKKGWRLRSILPEQDVIVFERQVIPMEDPISRLRKRNNDR